MAALRPLRPGRVTARGRRSDRGFTLVEVLIVIVILGVLATVTVFAVTGVTDKGETSACAAERKTLETALSAFTAQEPPGTAVTEAALVTEGFLREQSDLYDVDSGGNLVPQSGASVTCS